MPTKIEWCKNTDGTMGETWNPVTGCSPISAGCAHCYAKRMATRLAGRCGYPADNPFRVTLHPERFDQPLKWAKPRRIFVCSMGDLFHPDVPANAITYLFEVMAYHKRHTFIVLTKRPERMASVLFGSDGDWFMGGGDYYENIWLGVTAENQAAVDSRIPVLLNTWMGTTFVSAEPLLSAMDLTPWISRDPYYGLSWVVTGAETGPGARPMDPAWARSLRDQCEYTGTPFFFKKMTGGTPIPDDLMIRQWPGERNE